MDSKNNILELWMMTEHLSEGDINIRSKDMLSLDFADGNDFYTIFKYELKKKLEPQDKFGGLILYFDVFDFKEVNKILHEKYNLKETYEDIKSGNKFSFAVVFDRDLIYSEDSFFLTASAYIRYLKDIPDNTELSRYEQSLREKITYFFKETSEDQKKFNDAVLKTLSIFENLKIDRKNCRFRVVKNVMAETAGMHSFFISDLKKAMEESTENLDSYLTGKCAERINLDSKKDSPNFNPEKFEEILYPRKYPLGRFPGNTKYALSFMQQTAVNLSTDRKKEPLISVNGPPGTGKTTLLKDIFAELAVQQAMEIYLYTEKFEETNGIKIIPDCISEKNIVVASSNNGAVQNIVNELPLVGAVDEDILPYLTEADYFMDISNSKTETDKMVSTEEKAVFWGQYSLEGGKKANVDNIISILKNIFKYLQNEYVSQPNVYKEFHEAFTCVADYRNRAGHYSENIRKYQSKLQEMNNYIQKYDSESERIKSEYEKVLSQCRTEHDELTKKFEDESEKLKKIRTVISEMKNERDEKYVAFRGLEARKPSWYELPKVKKEYNGKVAELQARIDLQERDLNSRLREEKDLISAADFIQRKIKECEERQSNSEKKYNDDISSLNNRLESLRKETEEFSKLEAIYKPLDMNLDYDDLQLSNPWFTEEYRIMQSRLFVKALKLRKQFLFENRKCIKRACEIWQHQKEYLDDKEAISAAWHWINLTIPVISSTFASFSRMCGNIEAGKMGHLFVDEAGQALPQAAVGAILRSKYIMVVGDPSQIKPVLTMDSSVMGLLRKHFDVSEKYLSDSASVQTLVDSAGKYGFYRERDCDESSWIGIPLWVHRRCQYPMFTISNRISYNNLMVQGTEGYGKTGWFSISGKADDKYVKEQGDFLAEKISSMMKENPEIGNKEAKDIIYVISPFSNVAYNLSRRLHKIGFTRYDKTGKPTNIGTVHTFQGKEAPIVFMVMGADDHSRGAAGWAVSEPNMMNVAATRAKKEFYIIGDKSLYQNIGSDVTDSVFYVIERYGKEHPELVEVIEEEKKKPDKVHLNSSSAEEVEKPKKKRLTGSVSRVCKGKTSNYAYVDGTDGITYTIREEEYSSTPNAASVIAKGRKISFDVSRKTGKNIFIKDIETV